MSQDINKKAFKQAEKELLEKRVQEVKDLILKTLEKIEQKKKEKARLEEELRVLKLDIEDLRNGKFEKIVERQQKSKVAERVSIHVPDSFTATNLDCVSLTGDCTVVDTNTANSWMSFTAGTYVTNTGNAVYLN